jgi:hypothetical protein
VLECGRIQKLEKGAAADTSKKKNPIPAREARNNGLIFKVVNEPLIDIINSALSKYV